MKFLHSFFFLALACSFVSAYDPSPLQDFCVAIDEPKNAVFVNRKFCKNPNHNMAKDFSASGLNIPGDTENPNGSNVTLLNADRIKGLNTLGISLARLDYAANGGLNPPHTHPRGTEILVVVEGTLYVGFVTLAPYQSPYLKSVVPRRCFCVSIGLIHFQFNLAKTNAVAFAGLSSQNPGLIIIADAAFGSYPPINPDLLAKAFKLDKKVVEELQKLFAYSN